MRGALDIAYLPQRSVKVWLNQRPSYLVLTENNCQCSSSRSQTIRPCFSKWFHACFIPSIFLQGLGPNSHPIHWASASQQEIWVVANCKSQPARHHLWHTKQWTTNSEERTPRAWHKLCDSSSVTSTLMIDAISIETGIPVLRAAEHKAIFSMLYQP